MNTLSVEELKIMADKLGYKLIKKQTPLPKLLPCKCGCTRRQTTTHFGGKSVVRHYRCVKCGLESRPGATEREQRDNWNAAVMGEHK